MDKKKPLLHPPGQKRVIFDESFNGQVQVSALTSKGFNALRLFTLGLVTITYVI